MAHKKKDEPVIAEPAVIKGPVVTERVIKKYVFASGAVYVGECITVDGKSMRDGSGRYTNDGEVYEGEWLNDQMSGIGKDLLSYVFCTKALTCLLVALGVLAAHL
jgi:MORN repeat